MAKKFKQIILLSTCAFFILAGCHEKVDWDAPPFESKPVMNGILAARRPVKVHVSLAVPYGANESIIVEDAVVNLFVDGEFAETLEYQGEGYYQSELVAEIGKEYVCEAHLDSYPVVRGSTIIPKPVIILGIEHINIAGIDEEALTYPAVKITFENNPDIFTCHEIIISLLKPNIGGHTWRPAELLDNIDPVLLNEGLPITLFSNEIIESDSYTMTVNYYTGSHSSQDRGPLITRYHPMRVELRTLSHSYYQYTRQLFLYEYNNEEPFFSGTVLTPFTLHSNIENGYGIFTSYSSVTSNIIYPEE
jgi:hypothetical protein